LNHRFLAWLALNLIEAFSVGLYRMAAEGEAIRKALLKHKDTTIPMAARLWTSFHAKMDSSVSAAGVSSAIFSRGANSDDDLRPQLNTLMKRSSPVGFSGTTKTAQSARSKQGVPLFLFYHQLVVRNDVFEVCDAKKLGNGVFALRDVTFEEVQHALPG